VIIAYVGAAAYNSGLDRHMRPWRIRVSALALAWLVAATLVAQQPAAPAQTASVSGDVVDETGQPARNVTLVLFPVDEQKRASGRESKAVQWAAIDAGTFAFSGIPPGEYRLAITQEKIAGDGPDAAFIRALTRPFPVPVAAGDQAQVRLVLDADLKIVRAQRSGLQRVSAGLGSSPTLPAGPEGRVSGPPGPPPGPRGPGAVSGTVTDAEGKPVAGAYIQRLIPGVRNGTPQYLPTGPSTTTDAQGVYHLTGLAPGEFLVAALARSLDLSAPGAPSVSRLPPPTIDANGRKTGYVTTFYPGTDIAGSAKHVSVVATEVTGISFSLQRQPLVDVNGTITGRPILALEDTANLLPSGQAEGAFVTESRRAAVDRDGHFVFTDVPYGPYVFTFTSTNGWAHESITVSAATEPLTIALQAPLTLKGRVEFLGDMPAPDADTLKPFRVRLTPAAIVSGSRTFEVPIQASGEFTVRGVPAGRYLLQSRTTPPWTEMSGKIGGADTLDTPVEITANRDDAVVVLVDREAGVSGTVHEEGDTAVGALVIVYSADRQHWTSGSRRVRVNRIVAGGGFSVAGLPPGQYLAVALPLTADGPPVSNALLAAYQSQAQKFDLIARQHLTIELKMIR